MLESQTNILKTLPLNTNKTSNIITEIIYKIVLKINLLILQIVTIITTHILHLKNSNIVRILAIYQIVKMMIFRYKNYLIILM